MSKKCKVIMLPSKYQDLKPGKVVICGNGDMNLWTNHSGIIPNTIQYEIYFISDDPIQDNDWRYCKNKGNGIDVGKGIPKPNYSARITRGSNACPDCRKIEATTSTSLGLLLIPQSFLEQYVAASGKIEEVELEETAKVIY